MTDPYLLQGRCSRLVFEHPSKTSVIEEGKIIPNSEESQNWLKPIKQAWSTLREAIMNSGASKPFWETYIRKRAQLLPMLLFNPQIPLCLLLPVDSQSTIPNVSYPTSEWSAISQVNTASECGWNPAIWEIKIGNPRLQDQRIWRCSHPNPICPGARVP